MRFEKLLKKLQKVRFDFLKKKSSVEELQESLARLKKKKKQTEDRLEQGDGKFRRRALKLELRLLNKEIENTRNLIKKHEHTH
jgi:predicted  nucleic acid-binding Zn-ribbon protein